MVAALRLVQFFVCVNGRLRFLAACVFLSSPTRKGLPSLFLISSAGVIGLNACAAGSRLTLDGAGCRFQVVEFCEFGRCVSCTRYNPNTLVILFAMGPVCRLPLLRSHSNSYYSWWSSRNAGAAGSN
jgi:hypothetical protein